MGLPSLVFIQAYLLKLKLCLTFTEKRATLQSTSLHSQRTAGKRRMGVQSWPALTASGSTCTGLSTELSVRPKPSIGHLPIMGQNPTHTIQGGEIYWARATGVFVHGWLQGRETSERKHGEGHAQRRCSAQSSRRQREKGGVRKENTLPGHPSDPSFPKQHVLTKALSCQH